MIVSSSFQACGCKDVIDVGLSLLRPGGTYIFVGMVHPNSRLNLTAEKLIRKCLTITGDEYTWWIYISPSGKHHVVEDMTALLTSLKCFLSIQKSDAIHFLRPIKISLDMLLKFRHHP